MKNIHSVVIIIFILLLLLKVLGQWFIECQYRVCIIIVYLPTSNSLPTNLRFIVSLQTILLVLTGHKLEAFS